MFSPLLWESRSALGKRWSGLERRQGRSSQAGPAEGVKEVMTIGCRGSEGVDGLGWKSV